MTSLKRRRVALIASSFLLSLGLPAAPALAGGKHHHSNHHHKPLQHKAHPARHHKADHTTKVAKVAKAHGTTHGSAHGAAHGSGAKGVKIMSSDAAPTLASRLAQVKTAKTLNYYPDNAGWSSMWANFDTAKINADLAKAQALGATNVRAILFPNTFGYPSPKPAYSAELNQFVAMADAHGMTVKLTLFDWWDGYSDVSGSAAWAAAILKPYKNDSRVIGVEVKNEFDATDKAGDAWAKKIVPAIRAAVPNMPLSFSVDGDAGAAGLAKIKAMLGSNTVDYYDFHFYGNSERALANIRRAQAAVAPTPLVIGEVGLNTLQNTEGEQAAFLARVFEAAKVAGVGSVAPWTLNDFTTDAIPTSYVSTLPAQYNYGLYRLDGSPKPAAAVVKAEWKGTALPSDLLDPGFELPAGQTPWRAYLPDLGVAVKTQAASHSGKWSISFSNTGKNSAGSSPSYRVSPIAPVQAGQKWHAEVWARGNAVTGTPQIALSWFDINDNWISGATSNPLPTGTTGWTKLTVDGPAPAGAASMQVHLKAGNNTGTVWFDDVSMSNS